MEEFIQLISCPISNKIFNIPILGHDNVVYECSEYINKFPKNKFTIVFPIKSFIASFLDSFPEYKKSQYLIDDTIKNHHALNLHNINTFINNKKYTELLNYTNFSFALFELEMIRYILNYATDDIIIHIIDNCIDINGIIPSKHDNYILLNLVCNESNHSNTNLFKKIIDHGTNLYHIYNDDGWTVLHQLVYSCKNDKIIKYCLDKNSDLFIKTKNGSSILDFIFWKRTKEIIIYALAKVNKNDEKIISNRSKIITIIETNNKITVPDREEILFYLNFS